MESRNLRYFLALAFATLTYAQTGTLTGTLQGADAAPPGLVIVVTNVNTNQSQRANVSDQGTFSMSLPPGTYRVELERAGKRETISNSVEIKPGINPPTTMQVDAGPVTELIEIQAEAPSAQDDPPDVGRAYATRFIRSLPIVDRNYQELNGLMTGISPPVITFPATTDPDRSRTYNTNGLPAFANDNQLDGISIREPFTGVLSTRVLPLEAGRQLDVRSNYSAEQGDAAGSITNILTRPGTNGLHGSAFGFFSNDFLQARNALRPPNFPDPKLRFWQYGATAGGPIVTDQVFFFLSYQGMRNNGNQLQFATVPTPEAAAGNLSGLGATIFNPASGTTAGIGRTPFVNATIPGALINPVSRAFLANLPAQNVPGAAYNLAGNVPYSLDNEIGDAKVDYRFTDATTGFFRYGITHANAANGSIFGPVVGGPTRSGLRNHHGSVSVVGNYNGWIAELRAGYNRYRNSITDDSTGQLSGVNFGTGTGLPALSITGLGTLGTPFGLPSKNINNNYEGAAAFNVMRGRHQIKFGVDIRSNQASGFQNMLYGLNGINGGFLFGPGPTSAAASATLGTNAFANSFAAFLLGAPTTSGIFNPAATPSFHQMLYSAYAADTIRLTSRIAVDLGVRYDIYSPVRTTTANSALIFNPATNTTTVGGNPGNEDYDTNNVAPRVGVAIRATQRTVFRAGYSINYFPLPFLYSGLNTIGTGATAGVAGSLQPTLFAIPTAGIGAASPNIALSTRTGFNTPYTQSYYAMVQQDLPWGFLFDLGYVGNQGRQLPFTRALNAAVPGTGSAGVPFLAAGRSAAVTEIGTGLTSNYNSAQVNLTKHLSKGASFAIAYTWSKALDYGLAQVNNFDRSANYGPANWDRTHVLTVSHLFALPVGIGSPRWNRGVVGQILANWELVGLFRFATGTPINVVTDSLACACPGVSTIQANPGTVGTGRSIGSNFFSAPPLGTLGALSRNSIRGEDLTNYNLSLFKSFAIKENYKVELRGEAFNLFNNFAGANAASNISLPVFGQSSAPLNGFGGRLFRVGVRVLF